MTNETYTTKYHSGLKGPQNGPLSLSLLVGQNTFMFAIFSENNTRCIEVAHVQINTNSSPSELSDTSAFLINNFLLHQKKFDKVQLSLLSADFTMVPLAFSHNPDLKPFLKLNTGISDAFSTRNHNLNGLNFSFAINHLFLANLESTFRNISIRHAGATSINLLLNHHSLQNTKLFLNIHDSCMELALKENNILVFYNNFRYENNEDVLYYLLFTMEQFELNPSYIKLSIGGQVDISDDLVKSIKSYVKQVSFCVHHSSIKLDGDLASLPHQYYFTLLNQHLCEL
jgi:hypothetical protein